MQTVPLRWGVCLCVHVAFCILNSARAYALDPARALSQYHYEAWTSERGLPANYVNAIVHGRDGYLWLGTEEGLARFDGIKFTVFDRRNTPEFTDHNIQALHEDAQGTLWIGTRGGGVLRYRAGRFTAFTTKQGLTSDRILAITSTPDGAIWIATTGGGLDRLLNGRVEMFTTRNGLSNDNVVSLAVDRSGVLWVGTASGGVERLDRDRFHRFAPPGVLDATVAIAAARDGAIWFGSRGGGLWRLRNGTVSAVSAGLSGERVLSLQEDGDGNIWVGTNGRGLVRVHGDTPLRYTAADGLPTDVIVTLAEDRNGGLWLGTGGAGLVEMRDTLATPWGKPEGLSNDIALALLQDRSGVLWVGTYGGGLSRVVNGVAAPAGPASLAKAIIYSLVEDSHGALWVGTGDAGVVRLTNGSATAFTKRDGLPGDAIYALLESADGSIWAGTRAGLARFDGRAWHTIDAPELRAAFVRSLLQSRDGSIYAGTNGSGLVRITGNRVDVFKSQNLANFIRVIHEDADGNIWVGTSGGGLNLLRNGALAAVTSRDGLADDVIYAIAEDGQDNFWMSSNRGLARVARADVLAAIAKPGTRVRAQTFGSADGMRSVECNGGFQPAAARTRDGALWFPTVRGVVRIDPRRVDAAPNPPQVTIEEARVNRIPVDLSNPREVPVGAGELEFSYAGLALPDPSRLHFQYQLENFDSGWVDAGARREAFYTNLPPGRYVFRVRAANGSVWSPQAATVAVQLRARFYQTAAFFTVCVIAAVVGLMGAYRWRLRVLRNLQADLMRLVRERTEQLEDANRKLAQLSYVDALTAVSNRRSFDEELTMEWRRSTRTRSRLSLLMVDIDGFKAFNDALGHHAGDACLRQVAGIIAGTVRRAGDTVARYGGEEFAVLLPDTEALGAAGLADRIRAAVEEQNIPHPAAAAGRLTVSIGVATMSGKEDAQPADLVRAADGALYQAKRDGRNRVRIA